MKLKYITIAIIASLVLMLTGCNKLISEEEFTTEITITDTYHRGIRKMVGGGTRPARYKVYFEYEGNELMTSQRSVYRQLKDKVDEDVEAVLNKKTYEDGTIKYEFKELVE